MLASGLPFVAIMTWLPRADEADARGLTVPVDTAPSSAASSSAMAVPIDAGAEPPRIEMDGRDHDRERGRADAGAPKQRASGGRRCTRAYSKISRARCRAPRRARSEILEPEQRQPTCTANSTPTIAPKVLAAYTRPIARSPLRPRMQHVREQRQRHAREKRGRHHDDKRDAVAEQQ